MGELLLLGVAHRDPEGQERLRRALLREAPDVIALELSEPSVAARRDRGPLLLARLASGLRAAGRPDLADPVERGVSPGGVAGELFEALRMPYELLAAREAAAELGARVELCDEPEAARRAVGLLESELLAEQNVRALLEEEAKAPGSSEPAQEQYRLARRYFADPRLFRYHFGEEEARLMEARDSHVAARLVELCESARKVVYVGGWEHLVDGGLETVWPRLKDRARRALLPDLSP